ncbi:MAG TPA: M81 family metallopeptidase [Chloroflexota bacterium]|nr:M81 family metallopeptidase [Chloroflexota bacterium]
MRVATGGFSHETNTFNPRRTTLERIRRDGLYLVGPAVLEHHRGTRTVLGGFADAAAEVGMELVPTFFATHGPSTGLIDREVVTHTTERLVEGITAARPDGVLLHLHGAAAADGISDPEAYILAAVRQAVGRRTPIVVVYDLHANIGPAWAEHADAIVGYKTAPHTDLYERGVDGVRILARTLRGEVRPVVRLAKPPVLVKSGLMSMTDAPLALIKPPMYWLMARANELERRPGVLNVSVAAGFGDADVPEAGMTMLATTDGDPALAQRIVDELAALAVELRRGFATDLVMMAPAQAVDRAVSTPLWPVILADQGNNTAGGSPGDGTAILAELKRVGWPDAALFIADAQAAVAAHGAGVGGPFRMAIGGKLEPSNGDPVEVEGRVRLLSDGQILDQHFGLPVDLGRSAVVRCGHTDIVLTERPCSQYHPGFFRQFGIEPRDKRITVVQSAHLFRDEFEVREHIPRTIIEVDSPGITNPNARRFQYKNLRRPIYPLDEIEEGEAAARVAGTRA